MTRIKFWALATVMPMHRVWELIVPLRWDSRQVNVFGHRKWISKCEIHSRRRRKLKPWPE